jgi:FkbM family methyltransferase
MKFYSQLQQDIILYEKYFKNINNGVFVEVGAHDGEEGSNTLFYEESLNWSGICIEPHPELYNKLIKKRKCICVQSAVCMNEGEEIFIKLTGHPTAISGLERMYDNRHLQRIKNELDIPGSFKEIITVKTTKLQNILSNNNINEIHYLSIDVEGAEIEVVKSIDFNNTFIHVISIENNYPDTFDNIKDILISNGFKHTFNIVWDEIFINTKSELINL